MKIVFASSNPGKIREMRSLIKQQDIDLMLQSDLGVQDAVETGQTFIENAVLKARHAAKNTHLPAIADDSGLIVPVLKGAPGVYSARFAGEQAKSADNIDKLLTALHDVSLEKRHAYFYCVMVFLRHALDPAPLFGIGEWHGTILKAPSGHDGFGYDPIFYSASEKKSAAELPLELKNKISHRGQALRMLLEKMDTSKNI